MADGNGCTCAAHSESECVCDADWTPQEVYDLRAEVALLRDAARKLYDIAASGAELETRRRMLDRMAMESFAENG
jgi:hypothetical protein